MAVAIASVRERNKTRGSQPDCNEENKNQRATSDAFLQQKLDALLREARGEGESAMRGARRGREQGRTVICDI